MMRDARPLLVFFSHARSGPARRMESLLAHIARKERTRLRVTRVDVDDRPDLADVLTLLQNGGAYVNVHTNLDGPPFTNQPGDIPGGEIRGNTP